MFLELLLLDLLHQGGAVHAQQLGCPVLDQLLLVSALMMILRSNSFTAEDRSMPESGRSMRCWTMRTPASRENLFREVLPPR
jgi:hypothetical protein